MRKKYIIPGIFIIGLLYSLSSCKDYLEMPQFTGFNQDSIFVNSANTETYLYGLYQEVPRIVLTWSDILNGPSRVTLTDEAIALQLQSMYRSHMVYAGNVNADWFTRSLGEDYYDRHWQAIRKCFIMLENVDAVPDLSTGIKSRIKAECQTLIAVQYFEMWKRYGGIPIVKESLSATDYPNLVRQPLEDVYNYIIELCDEAIANPDFPAKVTNPLEYGRVTKALAYGLKARTMLYAASPLFNSATPYMNFGENNNLICFTSQDKNRWKLAMDAAEAAINYCESNGYALVTDQGIDANYRVACENRPKDGNTEIIWSTTVDDDHIGNIYYTWGFRGRRKGAAANTPLHNQVEKYQNRDGSMVNWDVKITTDPNRPEQPYENLDPRFQQSIAYNGCVWYTNPTMIPEFYDPGEDGVTAGKESPSTAKTEIPYGFRKYQNGFEKSSAGFNPISPVMRLAEMYFIYAEASNEYQGPNAKAFDMLDAIRTRSGMPVVDRSSSYEELKDFIVNEKAVEFLAEDHRYFDLKRWKTPEPFVNIYNLKIFKYKDNTYTYEKYLFQTRAWYNWWYLHPFPINEVNKGYGLIQNPGW